MTPVNPQLLFRRLQQDDAVAMHALEQKCFSLPWTEKQCCQAFLQNAFAAFGLWNENRLIAYISVYHVYDEFEILNLAVDPEEQRRGYGRRILQTTLQVAHKMGIKNVALEVRERNFPAIALYKSCGFFQAGKRSHYYPDTGEDALILHYLPNQGEHA